MGITYGYCGEPTVSWKLRYSAASVGSCTPGKMNVMLVRTIKETIPAWYDDAIGSPYDEIRDWIEILLCDDEQIPSQVSLGIQMGEQYRWRPKDTSVSKDEVINYNEPCSSGKKRRKISRMDLTASISGTGALDCGYFESSLPKATIALEAVGGMSIPDVNWFVESCSAERPLTDWHKYSLSSKASAGEPSSYPDWTSVSVSISGLNEPKTSTLTISSVHYFTDQSPTDTDLESISSTLQAEADVSGCPGTQSGITSKTWVFDLVWPTLN